MAPLLIPQQRAFLGQMASYIRSTMANRAAALAVVTIQVTGANSAPQGNVDSYTVAEDGLLSIGSTNGVLDNDSDADGDPLQSVLGEGPEHGTLQLNEDGSFTYQPDNNFNGLDSFTYKVSDGSQSSDLITVNLTVEAIDQCARRRE